MTAAELRMLGGAAACWLAAIGLGVAVTRGGLSRLDALAPAIFGRADGLATLLTWTGYAQFLTGAVVAVGIVCYARFRSLRFVIALVVLQLTSQAAASLIKVAFARPRPDRWIGRADIGFSYPSGHAVTAIVFYGCLFLAVAASDAPVPAKVAGCALLVAWIAGICWSRVALGAHYPSDVVGGVLLGLGFLLLAAALARHAGIAVA